MLPQIRIKSLLNKTIYCGEVIKSIRIPVNIERDYTQTWSQKRKRQKSSLVGMHRIEKKSILRTLNQSCSRQNWERTNHGLEKKFVNNTVKYHFMLLQAKDRTCLEILKVVHKVQNRNLIYLLMTLSII